MHAGVDIWAITEVGGGEREMTEDLVLRTVDGFNSYSIPLDSSFGE